ncbi:MAG: hypothetical protein K6D91_06000 [Prevotella sp.]|nr:hypothetical protein [Prevotella sp.]
MGKYADAIKAKKAKAIVDDLLSKETDNDKIESLKEVLNFIGDTISDSTTLSNYVDGKIREAITAAIGDEGAIKEWADGRYEAKSEATAGTE